MGWDGIRCCELNHKKQSFLQLCQKKALLMREIKNKFISSTYSKTLIASWDSQPNKLISMNYYTEVKSNENDKCRCDNKNQFWEAYDKYTMEYAMECDWNYFQLREASPYQNGRLETNHSEAILDILAYKKILRLDLTMKRRKHQPVPWNPQYFSKAEGGRKGKGGQRPFENFQKNYLFC